MIFSRSLSVLLAIVFLAACAEYKGKPKQTVGTLLGAGLGALAGSQIGGGKGQLAAVAVGALAGAWLGGEAGKSLDKADQAYAERTAQNTLESTPTGQTSKWHNPDSGNQPPSDWEAVGADGLLLRILFLVMFLKPCFIL